MRIIYLAKHGCGDNNDENALTYAFRKLGHEVVEIHENQANEILGHDGDFLLMHKFDDIELLKQSRVPTICWDFDVVEADDPHLVARNALRVRLTLARESVCQLMLHTDGNWSDKRPSKRVQLMQGADERVVGLGMPTEKIPPIIFTGTTGHGKKRDDHINQLIAHYGNKFKVTGDLSRQSNDPLRMKVHGRAMANRMASAKIIVAPDGPATDRYWSNRVYLTLGFGGFLLHPHCESLTEYYNSDELIMYRSRSELIHLIDFYLDKPEIRMVWQKAGYKRTLESNLYRHRCEKLIEIVKERLGL